ncbi:hypothetical protein [Flavobacterium sp. HNIBRBA15423]|uniref:hypothetical protein n=1 Tax=Flavobacterium sp. HNIBRBA15423 TaxID=3458683 RepID=UPI004043E494
MKDHYLHKHLYFNYSVIPQGTSHRLKISSEWYITTSNVHQAPSDRDINNAGSRTNYTFAMRNKTVYVYNNKGVVATVPINRFVNPKN